MLSSRVCRWALFALVVAFVGLASPHAARSEKVSNLQGDLANHDKLSIQNPHMRARGTVRTVDDPVHGPVDIPGMPIKWKNHPNNIPLSAPTLGQHNEEILLERLGKSAAEIEDLRREGILLEKEI